MDNNKKFNAAKLADKLWSDIEDKADLLKTDLAKRTHLTDFLKANRLTKQQAQEVIELFQEQLKSEQTFDTSAYTLELYDLWTHRKFHYFFKDKDTRMGQINITEMDLTRYFDEKKIPMWQRERIIDDFMLYMREKSGINRRKVVLPLLVCYGGAVVLAFFTPAIMRYFGVLSPDAGWGLKALNVVIGFIFFFLIARRVNSFWLDKVLLGK